MGFYSFGGLCFVFSNRWISFCSGGTLYLWIDGIGLNVGIFNEIVHRAIPIKIKSQGKILSINGKYMTANLIKKSTNGGTSERL